MTTLFQRGRCLVQECLEGCLAGFIAWREDFDDGYDPVVAAVPDDNLPRQAGIGIDLQLRCEPNLRRNGCHSDGCAASIFWIKRFKGRFGMKCQDIRDDLAGDLFDLSVILWRKQTFIQAILDLGNPGAMKVMKSARADVSPIVYGHWGSPFSQ